MGLVYGHGINDGKYPTSINNKHLKEYLLWCGILSRAYSERYHKIHPTYRECMLSDNFKVYSYFYEWCNNQKHFKTPTWQLDKDIIIKGNKIYGEETCGFVPREINLLFTKGEKRRGECPIGVTYKKKVSRYSADASFGKIYHFLGEFDNPLDAFYAYKNAKENYIKQVAEKYKKEIDVRIYEAMMNYEVEITD